MTGPALTIDSQGAGVQGTTIALLQAEGTIPKSDAAVFADTGWEPREVYDHLDRLEQVYASIGVPFHRVSRGNLRDDHLDPVSPFSSMPLFVQGRPVIVQRATAWEPCACEWARLRTLFDDDADEMHDTVGTTVPYHEPCGSTGRIATAWEDIELTAREAMGRRQCTHDYKLRPVREKTRELLGYPPPQRVPRGIYAATRVGFSTDEVHRISDRSPGYARLTYPLLDLGMSRADCLRFLAERGWAVVKSACIGCPFHGNAAWRRLRDERPDEWADAVDFDKAIRNAPKGARSGMRAEQYLHRSLLPLDQAPIDKVSRREWNDRQVDLLDLVEDGDPDGCSPYGCRSGAQVLG